VVLRSLAFWDQPRERAVVREENADTDPEFQFCKDLLRVDWIVIAALSSQIIQVIEVFWLLFLCITKWKIL
jgi:hypothetical protein